MERHSGDYWIHCFKVPVTLYILVFHEVLTIIRLMVHPERLPFSSSSPSPGPKHRWRNFYTLVTISNRKVQGFFYLNGLSRYKFPFISNRRWAWLIKGEFFYSTVTDYILWRYMCWWLLIVHFYKSLYLFHSSNLHLSSKMSFSIQ